MMMMLFPRMLPRAAARKVKEPEEKKERILTGKSKHTIQIIDLIRYNVQVWNVRMRHVFKNKLEMYLLKEKKCVLISTFYSIKLYIVTFWRFGGLTPHPLCKRNIEVSCEPCPEVPVKERRLSAHVFCNVTK